MELIVTELSEFTRRSRSLAIAHGETDLTRGLEYGERVLVRSGEEYRTAVVVDIDFDLNDTHYRMVLGGKVPAKLAADALVGEIAPTQPAAPAQPAIPAQPAVPAQPKVSVQDVADLLARSGAAHRIPMQRRVAQSLRDR
ncbi:MAG: hypothetical protein J7518_08660 [Nocardioidaceae bacterium]|nr:hypothetical protein [Nocardioidaceae bacterium]